MYWSVRLACADFRFQQDGPESVAEAVRRCHAWNVRFIRFRASTLLIADAQRVFRQLAFLALLLGGLAAITWLTARQPSPPSA